MIEYAIVSGGNFFLGFLNIIEPSVNPIRELFAKIGLNLSVGETCFAIFTIMAVVIGSLIVLMTK